MIILAFTERYVTPNSWSVIENDTENGDKNILKQIKRLLNGGLFFVGRGVG